MKICAMDPVSYLTYIDLRDHFGDFELGRVSERKSFTSSRIYMFKVVSIPLCNIGLVY